MPDRPWVPEATRQQHAKSGPYSPALVVPAGELVVLSGQGPLDADGNLVGDTIEEQAAVTLDHCERLLAAAGCSLADVVRVGVYLADLASWERFNMVYAARMPEPWPARTAIGCDLLLGMLVEVDMWARRP